MRSLMSGTDVFLDAGLPIRASLGIDTKRTPSALSSVPETKPEAQNDSPDEHPKEVGGRPSKNYRKAEYRREQRM